MWDFVEIMCPYCGEFQQTDVDISAGSQDYWQDCQVCCCPILFELTVDDDQAFQV
ncbi:MAG: CPXCG motif-containing cysteine-rich protein, partial [Gammaproteobacteria bacterium]|nr:CPXCG motif-containing cysteine-rich protein [Gammaproteobacteria bacterium]